MKEVIGINNFIKLKALNSRIFIQVRSDLASECERLLYHSEAKSLFLGKFLEQIIAL
jgi:hypothetical protein